MILDQMKLIFDDEYSRLYFDEANSDHSISEVKFRHFANDVAISRPGLVGRNSSWDDRILLREDDRDSP